MDAVHYLNRLVARRRRLERKLPELESRYALLAVLPRSPEHVAELHSLELEMQCRRKLLEEVLDREKMLAFSTDRF